MFDGSGYRAPNGDDAGPEPARHRRRPARTLLAALVALVLAMSATLGVTGANAGAAGGANGPDGGGGTADLGPAAPGSGLYVGATPTRLADTRPGGSTVDGQVAGVNAVGPGASLRVPIWNRGPAPGSGIGAVALNVTAVGATQDSYLTVYPTGQPVPWASNLNFSAGQTLPNMVIAKVGADGSVSVYNAAGSTQVIVDLLGWFPDTGGFQPLTPTRLADTRPYGRTIDGQAAGVGRIGAEGALKLPIYGRSPIPSSGVAAVALNVTAVGGTADSYFSVFPTGNRLPLASNLNFSAGQTIPNMVIAKVGADGSLYVYNAAGAAYTIVDILGWFPVGSGFEPLSPVRLADTRMGEATVDGRVAGVGPIGPGGVLRIPVEGRGAIPASGVGSVALNVTATAPTAASYLTVYPTGEAPPWASNLNFAAGQTIPNMVIAKVGADGSVSVFNAAGSSHVVVDLLGWFPGDEPFPAGTVTGISAGFYHTCAVRTGGTAACWGSNELGQLGNGTTNDANVPTPVSGLSGAAAVAAGGEHTCALLTAGTVTCWGRNDHGQLGKGVTGDSTTPVPVVSLTGVIAIAAGYADTCALRSTGTVACWGENERGQLGDGTTTNSLVPVAVSGITNAIALTAGQHHNCAVLTGGTVKCWGHNEFGELGNGTTVDSTTPVAVTGVTTATALAAGVDHTCALLTGGTVTCWGDNNNGQLGNGTTTNSATPVAVSGLTGVTRISAGLYNTCALIAGGAGRCWGYNKVGELGTSTLNPSSVPVAVSALTGATSISTGVAHSCVVLTGATARCWGYNYYGQLGIGIESVAEAWPVRVVGI